MKFANIIVDISLEKLDRTFQYRIPEELQGVLKEGMQVRVPFGNGGRTLTGYVPVSYTHLLRAGSLT